MKKVFKFVKGKKDEKRESGGITPSQSGELISPAQTPEDERFLGLDNSSGYVVDFCGKDKTLTKLHKAAWQGNLEKLKSALKKVEIDAVDRHNRTALHFAVAQGHPNIVWFLLGNNAKTSICDDDGYTPLLKAIECGHKECMTLLLERGADVNVADYTGNTGLHVAVNQSSMDTASALLGKGADTEVSNNAGDYPLHIATRLENKDLVELLLTRGASVDVLDRENRTPLMLAAKSGNLLLAQLFFEQGAQLTVVDSNGWTAQDYAMLAGHEHVAASLKSLLKNKEGKPASEVHSNENSSWGDSQTETSDPKDPITQKLKEFFEKCSEEGDPSAKERPEDLTDSPEAEAMPPFCQPPRSWEIIQAGMIDENKDGNEPKRRSITALGTLRSRRESFTEGSANTSPKFTLSLNRRKGAKGSNSFAKQRFSFNEEESLKYWINEEKPIRKDLEKIEFENMSNLEEMVNPRQNKGSTSDSDWDSLPCESKNPESQRVESNPSESGTLGRTGTMQAVEEIWVANPQVTLGPSDAKEQRNSWDSEDTNSEREGSFPPPPTALELGVDMAKSIKYMKGMSVDQPVEGITERNLWKNAYESHSLDRLEEKDFVDGLKAPIRPQSASSHSEEGKPQKPRDRLIDVSRRINEQLECYDQALRELAESSTSSSGPLNYYSLPSSKVGGSGERRRTTSQNLATENSARDSGPYSLPYIPGKPSQEENNEKLGADGETPPEKVASAKPGERLQKNTKRHMLLAMREVKHAVHLTNTFKTSIDDQILSPLARPEDGFDLEDKSSPKGVSSGSEGASPAEENPFFGLGRQETVLERCDVGRKSSSSGTGEEPTLWLQDDHRKPGEKSSHSDEDVPEIAADEGSNHKRTSSFSPLGVIYREIQEENGGGGHDWEGGGEGRCTRSEADRMERTPFSGEDEEGGKEQSPDISLSSGPIEPLATEKDSGSEPESSHNDVTPTHNYALKNQHEWLKSHLRTATTEKNKLEEITAQLTEKAERLQYELADAKEAAKSRDEVIQLLQGQLARMEAAYTKSLEESVQSRLQLTSHEQEILHLKELCYKYEEEKESVAPEAMGGAMQELQLRIKMLEEEKERMRKEIVHLEEEKTSLEKRLKEAADAEILDQCQRWKERCSRLEEIAAAFDSKQLAYESHVKEKDKELLERERQIKELNLELGRKCLEANEENFELKAKLQALVAELESEKKKGSGKNETENSIIQLKKRNLELEAEIRKLEDEMEEKMVRKLKEKEEEMRELVKQFNRERDSLVAGYERKLLEGRSEQAQSLGDMIKRLQDQVMKIQVKSAEGSLQSELSELKDQWEVMSKWIAEMQSSDQRLNSLLTENERLRKEAGEGERARVRNEISELKNQVNGLRLLLCGRNADRQESPKAEESGGKRRVGKEDELAWSHLYGMKSSKRGERSSDAGMEDVRRASDQGRHAQLEFLELKKEILSLQNTISDEKAFRRALEGQIVTMHVDLNEKENLDKEIDSLRRKVNRNCVQRSEMELLQYQRELEAKREKLSGGPETRGSDDDYKAKCEMLAREREKFRSRRAKSFDPGGIPWSEGASSPPCRHPRPLQPSPVLLQSQSSALPQQLKNKLEEELEKSIRKHTKESSSSISSVNLELVKKKYFQ